MAFRISAKDAIACIRLILIQPAGQLDIFTYIAHASYLFLMSQPLKELESEFAYFFLSILRKANFSTPFLTQILGHGRP